MKKSRTLRSRPCLKPLSALSLLLAVGCGGASLDDTIASATQQQASPEGGSAAEGEVELPFDDPAADLGEMAPCPVGDDDESDDDESDDDESDDDESDDDESDDDESDDDESDDDESDDDESDDDESDDDESDDDESDDDESDDDESDDDESDDDESDDDTESTPCPPPLAAEPPEIL